MESWHGKRQMGRAIGVNRLCDRVSDAFELSTADACPYRDGERFMPDARQTDPLLWVDILPKRGGYLGRMATQENNDDRIALLQGTLDLLILKTLVLGPCHGQGVARSIQSQSEQVFLVDHGSLYVALQRLEDRNWIQAKWGVSENNRKARFYSLTPAGREQLVEKTGEWRRLTRAMGLILDANHGLRGEEA